MNYSIKTNIISLNTIVAFCSAILIFSFGKFEFLDLLGINRLVQVVLFIPIVLFFFVKLFQSKQKNFINPLLLLAVFLFVTNFFNKNILNVYFEIGASIIVIFSVLNLSDIDIRRGIKLIVFIAALFSLLALIQYFILILYPDLSDFTRIAQDDNGNWVTFSNFSGFKVVNSFHPIVFLGLYSPETYNFFGIEVGRMRSFLSEPSLINIFFLVPALYAFLLNNKFWFKIGLIIIIFSILSLSTSVLVCFIFSASFYFFNKFFGFHFLFNFKPLIILFLILFILKFIGVAFLVDYDSLVAQSDQFSFLSKGNSLVVRSAGTMMALNEALISPFGSDNSDLTIPTSIYINSILSAGFIGLILIIFFFRKLYFNFEKFSNKIRNTQIVNSFFFGIYCVFITFNDYGLLNFSGLILMTFLYKLVLSNIVINE